LIGKTPESISIHLFDEEEERKDLTDLHHLTLGSYIIMKHTKILVGDILDFGVLFVCTSMLPSVVGSSIFHIVFAIFSHIWGFQ
jgi:hypothetical protein